MTAVLHFGAGALGRGLILPRLAVGGATISIADTNTALVDSIRAEGGYTLTVVEPTSQQTLFIPIAAAFAIGRDDTELDAAIAAATAVTTSVQVPNLPAVTARLAAIWSEAPRHERVLVCCENMRKVGRHVAGLLASNADLRVTTPDCVVDRICATLPQSFAVEAERYTEWVIENASIAGADGASDVDRLFFRKRYLVNTLADSASFLGLDRGYRFLHEAIGDHQIIAAITPLLKLLKRHLQRGFGFEAYELDAYEALSMARLGNSGISRRLETVARDPWRKFGLDERFMEPIIAEAAVGCDVSESLAVLARIMVTVEPDPAAVEARLRASWTQDPGIALIVPVRRLIEAERR